MAKKIKIDKQEEFTDEDLTLSDGTKLVSSNIFTSISQWTLYLTVIVAVIARFKISNPDIAIVYSYLLIVGGAVGRYGTDITHYVTKLPKDRISVGNRHTAYNILWLFGILSLIFS